MLQNNKIYMSHSIRGKLGKDATPESMAENNKLAHLAAVLIRCVLPEVHLYVPGEHDEVISLLYQSGRISEEAILWADCSIIETCKLLLAWAPDGYVSRGMEVEIDWAIDREIKVIMVEDIEGLISHKSAISEHLQGDS